MLSDGFLSFHNLLLLFFEYRAVLGVEHPFASEYSEECLSLIEGRFSVKDLLVIVLGQPMILVFVVAHLFIRIKQIENALFMLL
jgi:hypothetical protein